jgi:hypothetical protein
LRNPCVDWGKVREFSVDFNNELAIRQTGVEDEVIVEWERSSIAALPGVHTYFCKRKPLGLQNVTF